MILHHLLTKAAGERHSVLWCHKKDSDIPRWSLMIYILCIKLLVHMHIIHISNSSFAYIAKHFWVDIWSKISFLLWKNNMYNCDSLFSQFYFLNLGTWSISLNRFCSLSDTVGNISRNWRRTSAQESVTSLKKMHLISSSCRHQWSIVPSRTPTGCWGTPLACVLYRWAAC